MHRRTLMAAAMFAAVGALQPAWAEGPGNGMVRAPKLQLLLQYESRSIGMDGVQRDSRHADRMFRDNDKVWIERELPRAVQDERSHRHKRSVGPHAGHAHDEAQGAPLLLSRSLDGVVSVQIVLRDEQRVIEVDAAHHGNVGYGGSWEAAYWLIDPNALQRMTTLRPPSAGVQSYELRQGDRTTVVDWDVAGQYARRIEHRDAHGLSMQRMTAEPQAMPSVMPWEAVKAYSRGDYSDLLD